MISRPTRTRFARNVPIAPSIGISHISAHRPARQLENSWFDSIPRKFEKHTGILSRHIADEDEVSLAVNAIRQLQRETGCQLSRCAGLIFTSPSFVPLTVARKWLEDDQLDRERLPFAADRVIGQLGIKPRKVIAINTFCAGYATACSIASRLARKTELANDEFLLIVTASRISRITDYGCGQTGGLFGDLATATLLAPLGSTVHPPHFHLLASQVQQQRTNRPFFDFDLRTDVLAPSSDGGKTVDHQRIVFSLDGMGIADLAPRSMATAAVEMIADADIDPKQVRFIVPHQAGSAIVRLAEMKLREAGLSAPVINGMTTNIGNVSSGSVPFTLREKWHQLEGTVLCPVASVGPPGESAVAQGCIALRSTAVHQNTVAA